MPWKASWRNISREKSRNRLRVSLIWTRFGSAFRHCRRRPHSINDTIGKAGIERSSERYLRGYHGRKTYYSDARGNYLREMEGSSPPLSGQRLLLTISAELQGMPRNCLRRTREYARRAFPISTLCASRSWGCINLGSKAGQLWPWIQIQAKF